MNIEEWFKNQDYDTGVALYEAHCKVTTRSLSNLKRGKNPRNMSFLINELRQVRNRAERPEPIKRKPVPVVSVPAEKTPEPVTDREASAKVYFEKINYGELPDVLKKRFRELKDIFYDMLDAKTVLNGLPEAAEIDALKVMLHIEALDDQRDMIWKELDHWKHFKTLLPTQTEEDFKTLTPQKLYLKKASLASSISKMKKRIEGWELELEAEKDRNARLKLSEQISRTTKKMHTHELNLQKIMELL